METETLEFTVEEKIARIVLDRVDRRNAMNLAFWRELRDVLAEIDERTDVRVVVLSARGPHFSSGIDINAFASVITPGTTGCRGRRRLSLRRLVRKLQKVFTAVEKARVPILAAVHGGCIGAGLDLVSACCVRYCTRDAYFVIKEVDLGMTADLGTLQRMPHLIPQGLLRELAYTGRNLEAEEAHRIGLVSRVFDDREALLAGVDDIAATIAAKSPLAVHGTKRALTYARDHSVADGLDQIATWNAGMLMSHDTMEALTALKQKRKPEFEDLGTDPSLG